MSPYRVSQWLTAVIYLGIITAHAQMTQIRTVTQQELASHLMTYVPPVYPAAAQTAHVQGDVTIKVEISPDGMIRSWRILSGRPMLRQAATSTLKQWRYLPFQKGKGTTAVAGNVLMSFMLEGTPAVHTPNGSSANGAHSISITLPPTDHSGEPDAEVAARFDIPWEPCTVGVIAKSTEVSTAKACKEAAAIADEFPSDRRFTERRRAYVYAATAYGNILDFKTAIHYADKAVGVVKLGHDDNSGSESAYSLRAQLRAFSGDLSGGDEDMSLAEDICRKAKLPDALKRDLEFHAELLKRMNRPQEAQSKLDEAAKL